MNRLFSELQWLPQPDAAFTAKLKALQVSEGPLGRELQLLAQSALNLNQLTKLARTITRASASGKSLEPLSPFRLAVLSNSTFDLIVPALVASAARHGIALEVVQAGYDQVAQQALDPASTIIRSQPDAVLFAMDFRALPIQICLGHRDRAAEMAYAAIEYLQSLGRGIRANSTAVRIFQTFAPPVENLVGNLESALPGTLRNLIQEVNHRLGAHALESGDMLFDVAGLAQTVGLADWHNPQMWNVGKLAFSDGLIPLYADHVARIIAALRGKSRKVLVMDLDNTLWGGVIGDDGLNGIRIAQGDAQGEAHLAVQRLALDLRSRGVLLAISSKNHDEIAREPFLKHPEMLLQLEHLAVFQANWNDKASNIQAIADELSLGLDAMVLLDDNPVERGLVRKLLPQVAVPELPEDPSYYARTLAAAGYFEVVAFAQEDMQRAEYYQQNARRAHLQKQLTGVDEYLASLDMTITFHPFDPPGLTRIVQLINKSNQYNLTTKRCTAPEIVNLTNNPDIFTMQVRLSDRFGDNGMISVVICRLLGVATWEIDTWLMSCRVLGRKVEHMVLREMLAHAKRVGVTKFVGIYKPTDRNRLVNDHYARLGFTKIAEEESGVTRWELAVDRATPESAPMNVVSQGFAEAHAGSPA